MPLPPLVVLLVGLGAATLAGLVSYFLTSNRAKKNAAEYRAKVQKIVTFLKLRIDEFEGTVDALRRSRDEAREEAQRAERERDLWRARATEAEADADLRARASEDERARWEAAARFSEGMLVEVMTELASLRRQMEKWNTEESVAEDLESSAIAGFSVASTTTVVRALRRSTILRSHTLRPSGATEEVEVALIQLQEETAMLHERTRTVVHLPTDSKE